MNSMKIRDITEKLTVREEKRLTPTSALPLDTSEGMTISKSSEAPRGSPMPREVKLIKRIRPRSSTTTKTS